jgi:hypothetical protein
MVIGHLTYRSAEDAVVAAAADSAFIAPCDIIAAVKRAETACMRAFGSVFGDVGQAPREIADDPSRFDAWYRERLAAIKSGALTRENDPLRENQELTT